MTILNSYPFYYESGYTWGTSAVGIIFGLLCIAGVILCIMQIKICTSITSKIAATVLLLVFVSLGSFGVFHSKQKYKEVTRYEVILDDNVDFKDFYNEYSIIEARGQLYFIEKKEE